MYADGNVTLSNGEPATWDQFVNAINDPSTVKGDVTAVPLNDASRKALADANKKVSDAEAIVEQKKADKVTAEGNVTKAEGAVTAAQTAAGEAATAVTTAKGKVTEAKGKVTEAENEVTRREGIVTQKKEAKTTSETAEDGEIFLAKKNKDDKITERDDYVTDTIDPAKKAYDDAVAEVPTKENEIKSLQTQQTTKQGAVTKAQNTLSAAQLNLSSLEGRLEALPKVTETKTSTVEWLQNIYSAATVFSTDFEEGNMSSEAKIFYRIKENSGGFGGKTTTLIITFYSEPEDGNTWTALSPYNYHTFLQTLTAPNSYAVYLGTEYKRISGGTENMSVYPANADGLLGAAVQSLENLTNNAKYQVTTTTVDPNKYQDETAAQNLRNQIATAKTAVSTAQTDYNDAVDALEEVEGQIEDLQKAVDKLNKTTIPDLKDEWENAVNGQATYDQAIETAEQDYNATVAAADKAIADAEADVVTAQGKVTTAQEAVATAEQGVTDAEAKQAEADQAVLDARAKVTDAGNAVTAAQKAIEDAEANVQTVKDTDLAEAEAGLQAAADAIALTYYQEITLLSDVSSEKGITKDFKGLINGNKHVITVNQGSLFNQFEGRIQNVGINGELCQIQIGNVYNTAVWNGSTGEYYNNRGTETTYQTLGELGFATRTTFGVNFDTDKLAFLNDDTRVYNITIAKPTGSQQHYVTEKNGNMKGKGGTAVTIPNNLFAKSATNDLKGIANVYYADGNNFVCELVEIKDKDNSFFLPDDIIAKELTYNRTFAQGQNAVCLPFVLNADLHDNIFSVCTYDEEDNSTFWFTRVTEDVPANRPALIVAKEEFSFGTLTDVTLAKTPQSQVIEYKARPEDASYSFGLLKSANCTEITNASVADYKIWGLTKAGKFAPSGSDVAAFPAFRMVIYSEIGDRHNLNAPRRIAVRDEKGIEIPGLGDFTTGVDDILVVEPTLEIATGQGKIIFTAEADFGKVPVYNLDGAVITVVDVTAGTTTANVEKGIYIVNGKKVMVK